jgi:hypothetical protein
MDKPASTHLLRYAIRRLGARMTDSRLAGICALPQDLSLRSRRPGISAGFCKRRGHIRRIGNAPVGWLILLPLVPAPPF